MHFTKCKMFCSFTLHASGSTLILLLSQANHCFNWLETLGSALVLTEIMLFAIRCRANKTFIKVIALWGLDLLSRSSFGLQGHCT